MTFVVSVTGCIVCIGASPLCGRTPHGGTDRRQTKPGAARLTRCDREGSAPVRRATAGMHRRARRPPAQTLEPFPGITSVPARMSSATTNRVEPERAERAVGENARGPEDRSRRTPSSRVEPTGDRDRRGAFLATAASVRPNSAHVQTVAARLARSHASKLMCAIGSAVWLVRCFSRRRSRWISTPELDRSRSG